MMKVRRAPAPFAVVGLGKVRELEVGGERLSYAVGRVKVKRADKGFGFVEQGTALGGGCGLQLAVFDKQPAEALNMVEDGRSGLLADDLAKQDTQ